MFSLFFSRTKIQDEEGNTKYITEPADNSWGERLYALPKRTVPSKDEKGHEYYINTKRLSGETDFNFDGTFYEKLKGYLKDEPEYLKKLERCKEQHNCLLNFSLMQSMGNMQKFKGRVCNDRLDKFIYYLGEFFENGTNNKLEAYLQNEDIKCSCIEYRKVLKEFLNQFKNLQDYCKKVYFISDTKLIEKLKVHGEEELTPENAKKFTDTYIDLAYCFWDEKYSYFSRKDRKGYLTIGSYFPDGGEVYTYEELSCKLTADLGVTEQKEIDMIIEKSINQGFMYPCGNNCYTR